MHTTSISTGNNSSTLYPCQHFSGEKKNVGKHCWKSCCPLRGFEQITLNSKESLTCQLFSWFVALLHRLKLVVSRPPPCVPPQICVSSCARGVFRCSPWSLAAAPGGALTPPDPSLHLRLMLPSCGGFPGWWPAAWAQRRWAQWEGWQGLGLEWRKVQDQWGHRNLGRTAPRTYPSSGRGQDQTNASPVAPCRTGSRSCCGTARGPSCPGSSWRWGRSPRLSVRRRGAGEWAGCRRDRSGRTPPTGAGGPGPGCRSWSWPPPPSWKSCSPLVAVAIKCCCCPGRSLGAVYRLPTPRWCEVCFVHLAPWHCGGEKY